ncbi:MAG: hypothetical protein KDC80_06435 [Saprospiraceae bacterium]|nr:hypothetical protein [Saprospiraceae bacterium]
MNRKRFFTSILFLFSFLACLQSQDYFRFRSNFTLKEISSVGDTLERRLIIGTCTFDNKINKLTYNLSFPHAEQWVIQDTFVYTLREGKLVETTTAPYITEHSIFKMLLAQSLNDFGLIKSGYKIESVKRLEDQVYITYLPPDEYLDALGPLVLIKEKKLLKGVIYYEPTGNMMFRQQLADYQVIDGLPIPGELTHIVEKDGKSIKRILTFEDVIINEVGNDDLYDYPIPELSQ